MTRTSVLPLCLGALLLAACSSPLVHDLDEAEANQILALLQQRGIAAEKIRVEANRTSYTVEVPRAQAASAWQLLRQENLPRPKPPGVNELFGKPGLVPTAVQERTLMNHALSGELARTLQALDGVLEARVHLVLPSRDPLSPPDVPAPAARASVLIRVAAASPTVDRLEVQRLVAGAVEDLRPEAVTVVVTRAATPASASAGELARLGPFQVDSGSRSTLRGVLVGGLALILLLCLALVLLVRRHRALLLRVPEAAPGPDPGAGPTSPALESSLGLLSRSMGGSRGASRAPPSGDQSARR